jgi:ribulose-bisphosphate carboxylase large chain
MAHPSFLGSNVVNPDQGIDHGIMFGTLMRLAGADISIFPNHGGRFSFSPQQCSAIQAECLAPLGSLASAWPSPGGGMTLDRINELTDFYGIDVALLVGGALHRGDLAENARRLVQSVQTV